MKTKYIWGIHFGHGNNPAYISYKSQYCTYSPGQPHLRIKPHQLETLGRQDQGWAPKPEGILYACDIQGDRQLETGLVQICPRRELQPGQWSPDLSDSSFLGTSVINGQGEGMPWVTLSYRLATDEERCPF